MTSRRRFFPTWLAPRTPRPRPIRNRMGVEPLEDRITPTDIQFAQVLEFRGDFNGAQTQSVGSDPVLLGRYAINSDDFVPLLAITPNGGTAVTLDGATGKFTVDGTVRPYDPGTGQASDDITLFTGAGTFAAADVASAAGFQLSSPYTYTGPKNTTITINSFGVAGLTGDGASSPTRFSIQGTLAIPLPGSPPPPPNSPAPVVPPPPPPGSPPAPPLQNFIGVSFTGTDVLYFDPSQSQPFNFSGVGVELAAGFVWNGVTIGLGTTDNPLVIDIANGSDGFGSFSVYGDVTVSTSGSGSGDSDPFDLSLTATLGNASAPGLTFEDWSLTEANFAITGGYKGAASLGGLQTSFDKVTLQYQSGPTGDYFALSGGVSVTLAGVKFAASLGDGNATNPGLTIVDGVVQFDAFRIEVSDLGLGSIKVEDAYLQYTKETDNGETTYELAGGLGLQLPGGWEADGGFEFVLEDGAFKLLDIEVSIAAAEGNGLLIGDTDVYVTYLSGSLTGLGTPNWAVSGRLGLAFGQAITLQGKEVRILAAEGGFDLNKDELVLSAEVGLGAVLVNGQISSTLLGSVGGTVTLDWGDGVYSAEVNGSLLGGLVTFDGQFRYYDHTFYLLVDAALRVPDKVPLIGGDEILGGSLAISYDGRDPGNPKGYVAAWAKIIGITVGVEYDITTGDLDVIGAKTVATLGPPVDLPPPPPTYYSYSQTFTMPDGTNGTDPAGATVLYVVPRWVGDPTAGHYLEVQTPDGVTLTDKYDPTNGWVLTGQNSTYQGGDGTKHLTNVPPGQVSMEVQLSYKDGIPFLSGASNVYTVTVYSTQPLDPDAIVWTFLYDYTPPLLLDPTGLPYTYQLGYQADSSGNTVGVTGDFGIQVDNSFQDTAVVSVYAVPTDESSGPVRLGDATLLTINGSSAHYQFASNSLPQLDPTKAYNYFVTVDDGYHPVYQSPLVADSNNNLYTLDPSRLAAVSGVLTETGSGRSRPLAGFSVYLDLNDNGAVDPGEPVDTTGADGSYGFPQSVGLTNGASYTVLVVLPPGFVPVNPGSGPAPAGAAFPFTATAGANVSLGLSIWQQETVAGTVTDSTGAGVAGVTVYLDLDGDGQLDHEEPTAGTVSDGTYQFPGLTPSTTYTVRYVLPDNYITGSGPSSYSVTTSSDPYGRTDGNDFALVELGTVRGTVTGNTISGGIPGAGQVPQQGWTVQLVDATGAVVRTTTTDVAGKYEFDGVPAGTYTVKEVPPSLSPPWTQISPATTTPGFSAGLDPLNNNPVPAVAVGDFGTPDGYLDYAGFQQGTGGFAFRQGNGTGDFSSSELQLFGYQGGMPAYATAMTPGDFNGDGLLDLAVLGGASAGSNTQLTIVYGSAASTGAFAEGQSQQITLPQLLSQVPLTAYTAIGIAPAADFDGDGQDDVVLFGVATYFLGSNSFYQVDVYLSGSGFTQSRTLLVPYYVGATPPAVSPHAVAVGDLNRDGRPDLLLNFGTAGPGDPQPVFWVAYGQAGGAFGNLGQYASGYYAPDLSVPIEANGGPAAVGDLNNDGIPDAVLADLVPNGEAGYTQQFYILQQSAVASWVDLNGNLAAGGEAVRPANPGYTDAAGQLVTGLAIVDVDQDGWADFAATESPADGGDGQVLVYRNQGVPPSGQTPAGVAQFTTATGGYFFTLFDATSRPGGLAVGDFDNDGQPDLLVADAGDVGARLLLNTSRTVTTAPAVIVTDETASEVDFENLRLNNGQNAGQVVLDEDFDGKPDPGEARVAGRTVYRDLNGNGALDPGEPSAVTGAAGWYVLGGRALNPAAPIRLLSDAARDEVLPAVYAPAAPAARYDFAVRSRLLRAVPDATVRIGEGVSAAARFADGTVRGHLVFLLEPGAPAGLTIDPITGQLGGTVAQPGVYQVTVRVRDTFQPLRTDARTFTLTVTAPPVVPPAVPPVEPPVVPPIVPPTVPPPSPAQPVVVGTGTGGGPRVRVFDPATGVPVADFFAFDEAFTGGVRVAQADVNGDGTADTIVGTGPGIATQVRVFDGGTGAELLAVSPFEPSFTGGVFVAAADVNGDGKADLVITPDQGGGPRVRVLSGADGATLADFLGIEDPDFRGGARAAVADVNGDGTPDLIVVAGSGGGPRVAGFDGRAVLAGRPARLFADFFAFEQTLRNGVFVAAGDLDGDGFADLILGGGPGGGPRLLALSGKGLVQAGGDRPTQLANFFAGDPADRGGVRVAATDLDGDAVADAVVGSGEDSGSRVTGYAGKAIRAGGPPPEAFAFDAFPGFTGGVFVG